MMRALFLFLILPAVVRGRGDYFPPSAGDLSAEDLAKIQNIPSDISEEELSKYAEGLSVSAMDSENDITLVGTDRFRKGCMEEHGEMTFASNSPSLRDDTQFKLGLDLACMEHIIKCPYAHGAHDILGLSIGYFFKKDFSMSKDTRLAISKEFEKGFKELRDQEVIGEFRHRKYNKKAGRHEKMSTDEINMYCEGKHLQHYAKNKKHYPALFKHLMQDHWNQLGRRPIDSLEDPLNFAAGICKVIAPEDDFEDKKCPGWMRTFVKRAIEVGHKEYAEDKRVRAEHEAQQKAAKKEM